MNPVEFEGQTTLLVPPKDSKRGECGALPVLIVDDIHPFGRTFFSYWRPTPEELAKLNAGEHVRLAIHGGAHPPVWIDVQKIEELP